LTRSFYRRKTPYIIHAPRSKERGIHEHGRVKETRMTKIKIGVLGKEGFVEGWRMKVKVKERMEWRGLVET